MIQLEKRVKIIFGCRVILWIIALAVTIHWIRYSFKLYEMGIYDVHEYATYMRPVLYKGLIISVACICISFLLRAISDRIKKRIQEIRDLVHGTDTDDKNGNRL